MRLRNSSWGIPERQVLRYTKEPTWNTVAVWYEGNLYSSVMLMSKYGNENMNNKACPMVAGEITTGRVFTARSAQMSIV